MKTAWDLGRNFQFDAEKNEKKLLGGPKKKMEG